MEATDGAGGAQCRKGALERTNGSAGQTCRGASTHYIWGVTFLTLSVLGFYMPQFLQTLFGLLFFRLVIEMLG